MKYKGELYGKIGNQYFDTGYTSDNYDEMLKALQKVIREKVNQDGVSYELSYDLRNTIEEAIKNATK